MPYFTSHQDRSVRVCKVLADVFCAALLIVFAVAYFGWLGGIVAFVILEGSLLAVDWLVPSEHDAASVVR